MSIAQTTGLIGYFSLACQQRIAKDASLCPRVEQEIALGEMSAAAWQNYLPISQINQEYGGDMTRDMREFLGLMEKMEARLRPTDWYERLVKSYVLLGVISDVNGILVQLLEGNIIDSEATGTGPVRNPQERQELLSPVLSTAWDCGYAMWAQPYIKEACTTQNTVSSRLSLWGRRVLGDVISTIRQAVTTYPDLFSIAGLDLETLLSQLNLNHQERMVAAGLKA